MATKAKKQVLPARAEPPAPAPAEFAETDPPPGRRPQGDPAPRYADLLFGETAASHFRDYDAKGRIPAGSVLCEFRGTGGTSRIEDESGYRVTASPPGVAPLGPDGAEVPAAEIGRWANRVVFRVEGRFFVILSPRGAA